MLKEVLTKNISFENLDGAALVFKEQKYDNNASVFTIKKTFNDNVYNIFAVYLFAMVSLISMFLNIIPWWLCVFLYLIKIILIYKIATLPTKEKLIVIPSLGYQVETVYKHKSSSIFLPSQYVQDIFINEVIFRQSIIYTLTAVTKDDKLLPLFMVTRPRLDLIELLYKKIQKLKE